MIQGISKSIDYRQPYEDVGDAKFAPNQRSIEFAEGVKTPGLKKALKPSNTMSHTRLQSSQNSLFERKMFLSETKAKLVPINLTPRKQDIIGQIRKQNADYKKLKDNQPDIRSFQTTIECYKVGKVIGKGAFGKVNLAIHRLTGKFVALKSIAK